MFLESLETHNTIFLVSSWSSQRAHPILFSFKDSQKRTPDQCLNVFVAFWVGRQKKTHSVISYNLCVSRIPGNTSSHLSCVVVESPNTHPIMFSFKNSPNTHTRSFFQGSFCALFGDFLQKGHTLSY